LNQLVLAKMAGTSAAPTTPVVPTSPPKSPRAPPSPAYDSEASVGLAHLVSQSAKNRHDPNFVENQTSDARREDGILNQLKHEQGMFGTEEEEDEFEIDLGSDDDELTNAIRYWKDEQSNLKKKTYMELDETQERKTAMSSVNPNDIKEMIRIDKLNQNVKAWVRFDMFFGTIVILNGVLAYLTTDKYLNEQDTIPYAIESAFLVLFIIEWLIRWRWNPGGFCGVVKDPWNFMDLCLILMSVIDNLVQQLVKDGDSGLGLVSVMRVLRLLRLVRLVRLLRLMQELWLLVSGLLASVDLVGWGLLMLVVVSYVFSLIVYQMSDCDVINQKNKENGHWKVNQTGTPFCGSISSQVLTQLKIATYGGSQDMRDLTENYVGGWILILFAFFIALASIGILNLIIGVMLNATISMAKNDKRCELGTQILTRHKSLVTLGSILQGHCDQEAEETGFGMLSLETVLTWFDFGHKHKHMHVKGDKIELKRAGSKLMKASLAKMEEKRLEGEDMGLFFAQAQVTKQDVETIFHELASVTGANDVTPDDFIEGCMWLKGTVHPLDVLHSMSMLQTMYHRIDEICDHMKNLLHALTETAMKLQLLMDESPTQVKEHNLRQHAGGGTRKEALDSKMAQEVHNASRTHVKAAERLEMFKSDAQGVMVAYDISFTIVIVLNAIYMGIDVTIAANKNVGEADDAALDTGNIGNVSWVMIDFVFCWSYIIEAFIRAVFLYQIEVQQSLATWYFLPASLWNLDIHTLKGIFAMWPSFFQKDRAYFLECLLAVIGVIDSMILQWFASQTNLGVLQTLRLARLMRFMRLSYRGGDTAMIGQAFTNNLSLLGWSFVMLLGVTYFFSLVTISLVKDDENALMDPAIQHHWLSIPRAMISMASIATFSNWDILMEEVGKYNWGVYLVLGFFILLTGIGILNLVTGVMVEAAFHVVISGGVKNLSQCLEAAREELYNATDAMFDESDRRYKENHEKIIRQLDDIKHSYKVALYGGGDDGVVKTLSLQELPADDDDFVGESCFEPKTTGPDAKRNVPTCAVRFCMWVTQNQITIDYQLYDGSSVFDPKNALLIWDGGAARPVHVLHREEGKMVSKDKGILLFANIPHHQSFTFTFEDGWTELTVYPEHVEQQSDLPAESMRPCRAVIKPHMTYKELGILLENETLYAQLGLVGIRADQSLMVFQKLDVIGTGSVAVDVFIDGILRMAEPINGLDVATAKSITRRLVYESTSLQSGTVKLLECLKTVTSKLRGIAIMGAVDAGGTESTSQKKMAKELATFQFNEHTLIYKQQNQKMERKIKVMRDHIEARKVRMKVTHGEDAVAEDSEADSESGSLVSYAGDAVANYWD